MLAAIDDQTQLHIVKWTGRVRLHAEAEVYCGPRFDAAEGVLQVPEQVLTSAAPFVLRPGAKRTICPRCRIAVQAAIT